MNQGGASVGIGINTFTPAKTAYPLVTGDEIAKPESTLAEFCSGDALDPEKAKGKIVYCKALEPGVAESVQMVGGEGFILETTQYLDTGGLDILLHKDISWLRDHIYWLMIRLYHMKSLRCIEEFESAGKASTKATFCSDAFLLLDIYRGAP